MGSKVILSAATLGGGSIGIALTSLAGKYAIELAQGLNDMSTAKGILLARDAATDVAGEATTQALNRGSEILVADARAHSKMSKLLVDEARRLHHNAQIYKGVTVSSARQGNMGTAHIANIAGQESIKRAASHTNLAKQSVSEAQKSLRTGTLLGASAKVLSVAFVFKDTYDAAKEFADTVNSLNN